MQGSVGETIQCVKKTPAAASAAVGKGKNRKKSNDGEGEQDGEIAIQVAACGGMRRGERAGGALF